MQDTQEPTLISIVVAFYNEETVLPQLLSELKAIESEINGVRYEFIFVNDASTDQSLHILQEAQHTIPHITIITLARRFGHMHSIFAGLRHCRGDAAVYVDADLQDPPSFIPTMVKEWLTDLQTEVVYTTRRTRTGESPIKLFSTKIAYRLLRRFIPFTVPIDSGDFKLVSRKVIDILLTFSETDPFFRFLVPWIGFKQKQLFYDRQARHSGKSHFNAIVILRQFLEISLLPFSLVPIRFTAFACGGAFIFAVGILIVTLLGNISGIRETNLEFLLLILLALLAFLSLAIGIIALYLGAVFVESKRRPHYVIDQIEGPDEQRE